jgi:hypothetical protein
MSRGGPNAECWAVLEAEEVYTAPVKVNPPGSREKTV